MTNTADKIEALAALVLTDSRARFAAKGYHSQIADIKIDIRPGRVYTKIDRSGSGMLMIENATGIVYGIKAYGQVHKGHVYGTLDEIGEWFWGEYYPRLATPEERNARMAAEGFVPAEDGQFKPAPRNDPDFKVGDGATVHIGSDASAWTVVSRTPKTMWLQGDTATLDPDFKPDFHPGGFVGHVSNQHQQSYTYERNPQGPKCKAILTQKGWRTTAGLPVSAGRRAFYDYNF